VSDQVPAIKPTLRDHWFIARKLVNHFLTDSADKPDGTRSYALLLHADAEAAITALAELSKAAKEVWEGQDDRS
jgi:hypothetical protein